MKIIIETVPHENQRYPTVGDWFYKTYPPAESPDGKSTGPQEILHIKVSRMTDWRHEACVILHELAEVFMCKDAGISQEDVDKFDKDFEAHRQPDSVEEPGDSKDAPYRKQHGIASGIERILGAELGVDWNKYADEVEAFP